MGDPGLAEDATERARQAGASTAAIRPRPVAFFVATSGHSGVDRVISNLTAQLDDFGIAVDLLHVRGHGPDFPLDHLRLARRIDLGSSHVLTSLPGLVRYLRRERPVALLSDKDRVNRAAVVARRLAGCDCRLALRLGSTMSVNLAKRPPFDRWLQTRSIRYLYPQAGCLIVPSRGVADDLVNHLDYPRGHLRVVASPIVTPKLTELAEIDPGHPWFAPGGVPVVLGVGELSYRKDFATLIRAFAQVRKSLDCRLMILGRGRERDALIRLATELGVAADLDLPGYVDNPYAYLSRARVFALSSRWEGMPVALIEALACSTPVVATDCPSGPREILSENPVGTLVPVGDYERMAEALRINLERTVEVGAFEGAVAPYRAEASAAAYLHAMGVSRVAGVRGRTGS